MLAQLEFKMNYKAIELILSKWWRRSRSFSVHITNTITAMEILEGIIIEYVLFRWFKFTLKPPYRIAIGNFFSAIWDTSHWNFLVKFGLKTAWDMSYDILLSLLKFVNFWRLQGRLSILAKIGCLQKIKVFSMKEWQGFDVTWGF